MRRILSWGLMCVMVVSLVCVAGCGGGSGSSGGSKASSQESSGKKKVRKKLKKKLNMEEKEDAEVSDASDVAKEPPQEETPQEVKRTLPEQVADWTADDYLWARATKAKELDDAIAFLTEPSEAGVAILASLLTKPEPPARGEAPAPAEPQMDEDGKPMRVEEPQPEEWEVVSLSSSQIRTVVETLLRWDTPEANAVLAKVVRREILTDDDRTVVGQILDGYASRENLSPELEQWMLSLLLDADAVRPLMEVSEKEEQKDAEGRRIDPNTYWTTEGKYIRVRYSGGSGRTTDITPAEIRLRVLERYGKNASSAFRVAVARFLTNPDIDPSYVKDEEKKTFVLKLLNYLMENTSKNFQAQLVLYRQNALDINHTQKIETTLVSCLNALCRSWFLLGEEKDVSEYLVALREYQESRQPASELRDEASREKSPAGSGSGSLLGQITQQGTAPEEKERKTRSRRELPLFLEFVLVPDEAKALRKELWSPEFIALLQKRMAAVVVKLMPRNIDLEAETPAKVERLSDRDLAPFQMYLMIPSNEVRQTVFGLLDRGWVMGPETFRQAGLLERMVTEPGFLLAVKTVKRDDAEPELSEKEKEREAKKAKNRPSKVSKAAAKKEREKKIAIAWQAEVFREIQIWMKKLEQAAEMQRIQKGTELADVKVPESFVTNFALPEDAATVAYYRIQDPVLEGEKNAKEGLKISYAHVQLSARYATYLLALKKSGKLEQREIGERGRSGNVVWLERFEVDEHTGRRISVDVLIERSEEAVRAERAASDDNEKGKKKARAKENREPEDLDVFLLWMEGPDWTAAASEKPASAQGKGKKGTP
ncbi:MAG: hypothetical protein Q4D98_06435 [Planctomycetia bacterium]|nr:hypothetical protein [Planctomycetia bacterium]